MFLSVVVSQGGSHLRAILTALMSHAREWSAAPMVLHTPRPIQNTQAVRRHETELTALR